MLPQVIEPRESPGAVALEWSFASVFPVIDIRVLSFKTEAAGTMRT